MSITKYDVDKALNQLATVVVGRERALETGDMATDPTQRIYKLKSLVDEDYRQANERKDTNALRQIERTMSSLQSLVVLAELSEEVEW